MDESKRVLVITIDPAEAAFRLRLGILPELLRDSGFTFDFQTRPAGFWDRQKLVSTAGGYHAVIVQRKLLDPSHARILARRAKRVFFDLDDAVMVQRRKISRWSQWLKNRRYYSTAVAADHVLAGNEFLAAKFRELGCEATVLPTVVDPLHYHIKEHRETSQPALVWIGSKSTLPYLQQWLPAIEAAARRLPGLRLITIANDTVHSDVVKVEHRPWSLQSEAVSLQQGDIGIAPTPIDQWSAGKSGFKIIQYMATGLPTVASPVGANEQIITDGVTGFLSKTFESWTDAIVRLALDAELRAGMGATARQCVLDQYTVQRAKAVWLELLTA